MHAPLPTRRRTEFQFRAARLGRGRAGRTPHVHPDPSRSGGERRRLPLDARRQKTVRLHLGRAGVQLGAQPAALDRTILPAHGLPPYPASCAGRRRAGRLLCRHRHDRLQRRHPGRGRGEPGAARSAPPHAGGPTARPGDVGRVRLGGDPESAVGVDGARQNPASDLGHPLRLPREKGPGQRGDGERTRRRTRPARPLLRLPHARVRRRGHARGRLRPGPLPPTTGRPRPLRGHAQSARSSPNPTWAAAGRTTPTPPI